MGSNVLLKQAISAELKIPYPALDGLALGWGIAEKSGTHFFSM